MTPPSPIKATHHRSGSGPDSAPSTPTSNVSAITLPYPHKTTFSLLRALLLTPAPPPSEAPPIPLEPHEFIDALHKPRIYKTYLQELSDVCRDYFWVFCHPNNAIWNLRETDEGKVEKPRAPGGMTGGVEFEAMGYLVGIISLFLFRSFLRYRTGFSDIFVLICWCRRCISSW